MTLLFICNEFNKFDIVADFSTFYITTLPCIFDAFIVKYM